MMKIISRYILNSKNSIRKLADDLKEKHDRLVGKNDAREERQQHADEIFQRGVDSIDPRKLEILIEKMRHNRVFLCPTLHVGEQRIQADKENTSEEDKRLAVLFKKMGEISNYLTAELAKHQIPILVGHDGLNPEWTWKEMELLARCGLSPLEIIRGATLYPAQWFGKAEQRAIAEKQKADIVLLDENPFESIKAIKSLRTVILFFFTLLFIFLTK